MFPPKLEPFDALWDLTSGVRGVSSIRLVAEAVDSRLGTGIGRKRSRVEVEDLGTHRADRSRVPLSADS